MFKWIRDQGGDGLDKIEELFVRMLIDGRHVFDVAMSARVGGADPAALSTDLLQTEERTDEAEREIRRRILVHASVHGGSDFPACLMYMSIAKDAERVADLSKSLFHIAETVGAPPPGPVRDDLVHVKDAVSEMISEAAVIFSDSNEASAESFVERARAVADHCRDEIDRLLADEGGVPQAVATALTYRQISRILSNLLNIVSSVIVPLDQLDYPELEGS